MPYATLQADIADWIDRDDLGTQIPKFIRRAEDEFLRELSKEEAVFTGTASGQTLALPSDFGEFRSITLTKDDYPLPLTFMSLPQMQDTFALSEEDTPRFFAIQGSELVFAPAPDQDYDVKINYRRGFVPLSDANTTNWLLDDHSDLYMAGTQWQASVFLKHWEAVDYFRGETGRIMEGIKRALIRKAYGGAPLAPRGPVATIRGVRA